MRKWIPLLAVTGLCACGSDPQETAPDATAPTQTQAPAATASPLPAPSATPAPGPSAPGSATASAAADGRMSRYTSLSDCRVVRSAPDEAGFVESTCPGMGDYRLKLVEADGRQNVMLVSSGKEHSLALPAISGGGFSEIGRRVEWRGRETGGEFRPDAMILRYDVVENFEQPSRPTSYLLPVSLARTPCLTAKIRPGAGQNDRARAAADGPNKCL